MVYGASCEIIFYSERKLDEHQGVNALSTLHHSPDKSSKESFFIKCVDKISCSLEHLYCINVNVKQKAS